MCVSFVLVLSFIVEVPVLNANSVAPDQTPPCAASDLGINVCKRPFNGTPSIKGLISASDKHLILHQRFNIRYFLLRIKGVEDSCNLEPPLRVSIFW